jgi:tRNA(Ile)-lysidine synthase
VTLSANRLLDDLRRLPQSTHCHIALSGGLDSCVLLHLLASISTQLPWELRAIHVHHGLQADADRWQRHCETLCEEAKIPLTTRHLGLRPKSGESLEAQAREARYQALAGEMGEGDLLLTAQHQDDQAETLLLQLLRGSGPAGLAAMPGLSRFATGWLARPLLTYSRTCLQVYAQEQGLSWMEDPSNRDLRFDRNFIRHQVMPLLRSRWPSAPATLSRSARLSGELLSLAREEAERDLCQVRRDDPRRLSIPALRAFNSVRLRNLLRHWIASLGVPMPHSRQLARIEAESIHGRSDASPLVAWGGWEVRRFRAELLLQPCAPGGQVLKPINWPDKRSLHLPDGLGRLIAEPGAEGLSESRWRAARVEVRFRVGGESCLPAGQAHHRPLKKLFQEWGLPPWERARTPLIYLDGELAAIPGRLLCQPFAAEAGEAAIHLRWEEAALTAGSSQAGQSS